MSHMSHMFLKANQGLGRTYLQEQKKKDKITKTKPNKPKKKRVTPPKTCALVSMMVYSK